jgi:hypothetical protein
VGGWQTWEANKVIISLSQAYHKFQGYLCSPIRETGLTRLLELIRYHSTTVTNSLLVVSDWITLVADYGQLSVSMGNQDRTLDTVDTLDD